MDRIKILSMYDLRILYSKYTYKNKLKIANEEFPPVKKLNYAGRNFFYSVDRMSAHWTVHSPSASSAAQ